jgi:hypothetical protein
MTSEQITAILAERVMGWGVAPDRFLMGSRRWMPRWRFQPAAKLLDAFQLLEKAAPQEYCMRGDNKGSFWVRVRIGEAVGEASGVCKALVITCAVARALGVEADL